ncbi:MAG: sugar phosphate isomerase/epimerase [Anaerolineae bacterium]|nr:sugar phosphate isomerase/epimerase [Anaerolineae bacterium]
MYLTGFADEAAPDIDGQIRATKELGWQYIESRNVNGTNIHDVPEEVFEKVVGKLQDAGVQINCFGSAIANWGKSITDPFDITLAEVKRAIPRMQRLGTKLIRIMSYAVLDGRGPDDQMEEERFRRLRIMHKMFTDVGLTPVHENCMNYGGMSWQHTLRLIENAPGLKLVFDTGNPIFTDDRSKPKPYPKQSSWEFYSHVKEHIAYVHIKDGRFVKESGGLFPKMEYTFPGDGDGDVVRIVKDLLGSGYEGGISIEPHLSVVHHDESVVSPEEQQFNNYVEYGRRMERIIADR